MLRHIAILLVILSIIVSANAGMFITMDDVVDPFEVDIVIGGTASVGLFADNEMPQGTYFLGILEGQPGLLDESTMEWIYPDPGIIPPPWPPEPPPGWKSWIEITFVDTVEPIEPVVGQLVDNITFYCEGPGNVTIRLLDANSGELLDSQVIHQIPEPGTIALLGLGVFMLKRRR